MTKARKRAKLIVSIEPEGPASGRAAKWKWYLYADRKLLDSGTITGARQKAVDEARAAKDRWAEAFRTGDMAKAKKPVKAGTFLR
jgi:hypothetical protein